MYQEQVADQHHSMRVQRCSLHENVLRTNKMSGMIQQKMEIYRIVGKLNANAFSVDMDAFAG